MRHSYSYQCEIGNHYITSTEILPKKCNGCVRQMCEQHRIRWGPYCKECWPAVPSETQQSLIAECKAIRKAHRVQFLKDLPKVLVLLPLWSAAYIWQTIKKQGKNEKPAPKLEQPPYPPSSDHRLD